MNRDISASEIRKLISYDPDTGEIRWRASKQGRNANGKAGYTDKRGYVKVGINYKCYFAHNLIYLYMMGEWPTNVLDHKDLNPGNNSWENLRPATNEQNCHNRSVHRDNKLGLKGVDKHKRGYRARITLSGKRIELGHFSTPEEASVAYNEAAKWLHGEFAWAGGQHG